MTNAWQALRWLDSGWLPQISQALVHFLWQGLAIAIFYAVAARCLRGSSANARYAAGVAALLLMAACLPLTLCMLPAPAVVDRDLPTVAVHTRETVVNIPKKKFAKEMLPHEMHVTTAPMKSEPSLSTPVVPEITEKGGWTWHSAIDRAKAVLASLSPFIIAFYFCGVGLMMLRVTFGLWGGHRLRRDSTPCDDAMILRTVAEHARRMAMRVAPAVAYCRRVSTPLVVGVLHPMILLPTGLMSSLSAEQIEAVLVHELAHIRRFDLAINILQRLIEAILFFHPAVWWVSRRISRERENCCDDFVLRSGWQRADYANALVSIAAICSTGRIRAAALGAASNGNSDFKRRIMRLLLIDQAPRMRLLRTGTLALTLLVVLALSASAFMVSRLMAQSSSPTDLKQPSSESKAEVEKPKTSLGASSQGDKSASAATSDSRPPAETVTFDGTCVDSDEHWIADAEVMLYEVVSNISQKLLQKRQTDAKGKFAFDPVPLLAEDGLVQSHYAIVAAKKGKATVVTENLRHSKNNTHGLERLELSLLEPGIIEGRITDTEGKPVAGAQVYPGCWQREPVGIVWGTTTDADGNYRITDYPKFDGTVLQRLDSEGFGTYKVSLGVRHPNYLRASLYFSKAPAKINAKLQPGAAIEGLVLDDVTGKPAAGVILFADGTFPFLPDWSLAITDAEGRYRLSSLKANKCALGLLSKDRTMRAVELIGTKIGETSKAPDIHLVKGGMIEGRLLDAATGLPIHPDPVDEMGIGLNGPSWPRNFPKRGACSVMADGSFHLRAVPGTNSLYLTGASPWQFASDATIKENVKQIEVTDGQTLKVDIKVRRKTDSAEPTPDPSRGIFSADPISKEAARKGLDEKTLSVRDQVYDVAEVKFAGNQIASEERLKKIIEIQPPQKVTKQKMDENNEKLAAFYRSLGYFRVRIGRETKAAESAGKVILTIVIEEGPRYKIRDLSFTGNVSFGSAGWPAELKLKEGEYFNQAKMDADREWLLKKYADAGYPQAKVNPTPYFRGPDYTFDLIYEITEGKSSAQLKAESAAPKKDLPFDQLFTPPSDVAGTVLLPDGKPAVGANLAICSKNRDVYVTNGKLDERYLDKNGDIAETAADGSFKMPGREGKWVLVAVHDGGYAEVEDVEFAKSPAVKLRAWGRIEGKCAFNGKPTPDFTIDVGGGRGSDDGVISVDQTATTDAQGKFTVERVPPVTLSVQPFFKSGKISFSPFYSMGRVTVLPGETTRITLPREGRPITGRVVFPPDSGLKIEDFTVTAKIYYYISFSALVNDKDLQNGYKEFGETDYAKAFKRDNIPVNADGTFRIERMPEARYILQVQATQKPTSANTADASIDGLFVRRIEVPPLAESQEPVDLGELVLRVEKQERPKAPAKEAVDPVYHFNVVVAKHVNLLEGKQIVTWPEIEAIIAKRPNPSQTQPSFYITRGATEAGRYEAAKKEIWRLHQDYKLVGHSEGSLWPRADLRYDRIQTPDDLKPDESLKIEGVVKAKGKTVAGAEVVLITPVDASIPYTTNHITLVKGRLYKPLEEVMTRTNDQGHFALYPPKGQSYYLIALHPDGGIGFSGKNQFDKEHEIHLLEWSGLETELAEESEKQTASLSTRIKPSGEIPEIVFNLECSNAKEDQSDQSDQHFVFKHVPPIHETTIYRNFPGKEGTSFGLPGASVSLLPGETRRLDLGSLTEQQQKYLDQLRHDSEERRKKLKSEEKPPKTEEKKADPPAVENDFSKEMKRLETLNASEVGRDVIVVGYEELLKKFPDHPKRAQAMLKLASVWGITVPERQIQADEEKLIAWVRQAREAAVKGSDDWLKAQFWLAARVRWKNSEEARHLLEEIEQVKPGPVIETQMLVQLQEVALFENKFEEAEKICIRLQEWDSDPARMPEKLFDKGQIYFNQQQSASSIMNHWMSHLPRAESERKLHEFVEKYSTRYNQRELERMLKLPPDMWGMQLVPYKSTTEEKREKTKGDEPQK